MTHERSPGGESASTEVAMADGRREGRQTRVGSVLNLTPVLNRVGGQLLKRDLVERLRTLRLPGHSVRLDAHLADQA